MVKLKEPIDVTPKEDKFIVTFTFTDGTKEVVKDVIAYGVVQQYPTLIFYSTPDGSAVYYPMNNLRKYSAKKD